jgi:putative ABC transport system ATP-binding protein
MGLFQTLNKQGKTILFVTHEPDIANMSKRTITLKDGLIVQDTINLNPIDALEVLQNLPTKRNDESFKPCKNSMESHSAQ